jgi:hypothetical protein
MLRLAADPKRWISVTAPLSASSSFRPAWWVALSSIRAWVCASVGVSGFSHSAGLPARRHALARRAWLSWGVAI